MKSLLACCNLEKPIKKWQKTRVLLLPRFLDIGNAANKRKISVSHSLAFSSGSRYYSQPIAKIDKKKVSKVVWQVVIRKEVEIVAALATVVYYS